MRFLTTACDLMILNLLTILLCLPVVTAVPALTALHYMTLKMARGEQTYLIRPYFKSFAENFQQSFVIGLILLAVGAVIYADWYLIWFSGAAFPQAMKVMITAVTLIVILLLMWVIPVQAHFENTIGSTFKNAVLLSLANFPRTLGMISVWLLPVAVALISYVLWPLIVLFGLSVPAYFSSQLYSPAFLQFEPKAEETVPDELFSMNESDLDVFAENLKETMDTEEEQR